MADNTFYIMQRLCLEIENEKLQEEAGSERGRERERGEKM